MKHICCIGATSVLVLFAMLAPTAYAVDCTLTDWAILQLDYDWSHYYYPPPTSEILDIRDIPGPGVEFDIWYKSNTNWTDATFHLHSSTRGGVGTLVGARCNCVRGVCTGIHTGRR